ncbi:MAG: Tmc redox complex protein TmcD [Desulfobacteraceae bacterium]|nr:MAG: Tmc redox complex protein TmcD [Desulfobacteraceae bacterium]
MNDKNANGRNAWDWQTEKKQIPVKEWESQFNWVEEPHVSPDGEQVASIVNSDEAEFSICVNGDVWEDTFEKAWSLKFSPDGRLAVLAANDEEWTVCIDGTEWESRFDYIWGMTFSSDGSYLGAAIQQDGEYGVVVNDEPWESLYENMNHFTLSEQGGSAAVVQVSSMSQGDIDGFAGGLFSLAVNGEPMPQTFMNIWDPAFDSQGKHLAFTIRKNRSDYSIFQVDTAWDQTFQSAWKPAFIENDTSLVAPVRTGGKWYLYKNARPFWSNVYEQLWQIAVHQEKKSIAAIVSDSYGKWTVSQDDRPWTNHADQMITDLSFSEQGDTLCALFKTNGAWTVVANDKPWDLGADKLWKPAMDATGEIVAARFEKQGRYHLAVNGRVAPGDYDMLFDPEISPDGTKILIKSITGGIYSRQVLSVDGLI